MQSGEENRRSKRWMKNIVVHYLTDKGEHVTEQAVTADISEGGLQLILAHKLELGETIDIKMEFVHDLIPILATCRAVYVIQQNDKFRTGLQFVKIKDFQKERILRYLDGEGK